ncbi:hypothetical protein DER46DRAFT_638731 [Fusarium sp. MPI-SDFR-AT-0072]|nr:hypothetical protein DER46DRAFT_638731 [Fusarium sp. MPI-SDFR-AT-0072]
MLFTTIITYLAVSLSIIALIRWRLMAFAQKHYSWCVTSLLATIEATYGLAQHPALQRNYNYSLVFLLIGATSFRHHRYLLLRWKAWTGQSRTGISPDMTQYIGSLEDWKFMAQNGLRFDSHPIDRFSGGPSTLIRQDPTDLLKARADTDISIPTGQTSQPRLQSGVYQPTATGVSVSLLWGENLGFQRRCSRGIISVPVHLFKTSPMLRCGLPGEAICLAFGVLSRNKGLEPRALICNLKTKNSFRQWEEAGVWPHPAKTLRSFYYSEFETAFSLLGDSYITAATELALLFAELDGSLIGEWLDRSFEHQDLEFNNLSHAHGASQEDLFRLYRGHYAAMLISLSLSARHRAIRPELVVFDAVCRLDDVPIPKWATSEVMESRRQAELELLRGLSEKTRSLSQDLAGISSQCDRLMWLAYAQSPLVYNRQLHSTIAFISMEASLLAFLVQVLLYWGMASSAPTYIPSEPNNTRSSIGPRSTSLSFFQLSNAASTGFVWSSIGLAILTAFLQGLVTSLAYMTESSNSWTFRFRLAKVEHLWWTLVSCLLFTSLFFNVVSFVTGNSNEAVAVLVLSTTTLLAIMDPTDILKSGVVNPQTVSMTRSTQYTYHDGYPDHGTVSLYWGMHSGFLPRVSRSISSVPVNLLKSTPFTNDGFAGEGLCLAMGILGRNKGFKPRNLVFNMNKALSTQLENDSTWYPRPAKTLRSYYQKLLEDIYGGLGNPFVCVAIELSLILMDASPTAVASWLKAGCEHQSIQVNEDLKRHGANDEELRAHYESSYVSMIISINNMKDGKVGQHNHGKAQVVRPDIICLGLLLKARGKSRPAWWGMEKFCSYRQGEDAHLDFKWKDSAAKLLGLQSYPSAHGDDFWAAKNEFNKESVMGVSVSEAMVTTDSGNSQISS